MLALKIEQRDVKQFMNKLLIDGVFDFFEFREAHISSFIRFELDGQKAPGPDGAHAAWKEVKPYAFNILRGSRKPKFMRFVLSYPEGRVAELDPGARALFLNIIFEEESVRVTTGFSAEKFRLDKAPESKWEAYVRGFLMDSGVVFEEQG